MNATKVAASARFEAAEFVHLRRRMKVSSSYQFQATNFINAMAAAIEISASTDRDDTQLQNFAPSTSVVESHRIQQSDNTNNLITTAESRPWMPNGVVVANVDFRTVHKNECELTIRDFANFLAQLNSPTLTASTVVERSEIHAHRLALSERSLTYADFRHAVDHQIEHTSSIWQNN